MSKSLGNVVDPKEILRDFGAEAMRFWVATEGDLSKQDIPCSKEKIKSEMKTMTKLINVSKFIMQFDKPAKAKPTALDALFIDYMENLTAESDKQYGEYDFNHPAVKLRRFLWEIFASHYLEIVKERAYNQSNKFTKEESDAAKHTLHILIERFLVLAYPIIPQITSVIAKAKSINLDETDFPKAKKGKSDLELIEKIMEFNSKVWKEKRDKNISLREPLSGIEIPKELKAFEKDLKACHNLQ